MTHTASPLNIPPRRGPKVDLDHQRRLPAIKILHIVPVGVATVPSDHDVRTFLVAQRIREAQLAQGDMAGTYYASGGYFVPGLTVTQGVRRCSCGAEAPLVDYVIGKLEDGTLVVVDGLGAHILAYHMYAIKPEELTTLWGLVLATGVYARELMQPPATTAPRQPGAATVGS